MTADKAVYKCPKCGYVTHFPKALEAHMKFRKHFLDGGAVKKGDPYIVGDYGQEMIVPPGTLIKIEINGKTFDEEAIKKSIEESTVNSPDPAEKKTKTVKEPRGKAEKE